MCSSLSSMPSWMASAKRRKRVREKAKKKKKKGKKSVRAARALERKAEGHRIRGAVATSRPQTLRTQSLGCAANQDSVIYCLARLDTARLYCSSCEDESGNIQGWHPSNVRLLLPAEVSSAVPEANAYLHRTWFLGPGASVGLAFLVDVMNKENQYHRDVNRYGQLPCYRDHTRDKGHDIAPLDASKCDIRTIRNGSSSKHQRYGRKICFGR